MPMQNVFPCLVSMSFLEKLEGEPVFRRFFDLAVIFRKEPEEDPESSEEMRTCSKSGFVRKAELAEEGITEDSLYETALRNAVQRKPAVLRNIKSIITDISEMGPPMYVLSNSELYFGASVILYPQIRQVLGAVLKEDLILIPSSIHEWIILPEQPDADAALINEIIEHVNRTEVMPDEVLGGHVYYFRPRELMLTM